MPGDRELIRESGDLVDDDPASGVAAQAQSVSSLVRVVPVALSQPGS